MIGRREPAIKPSMSCSNSATSRRSSLRSSLLRNGSSHVPRRKPKRAMRRKAVMSHGPTSPFPTGAPAGPVRAKGQEPM